MFRAVCRGAAGSLLLTHCPAPLEGRLDESILEMKELGKEAFPGGFGEFCEMHSGGMTFVCVVLASLCVAGTAKGQEISQNQVRSLAAYLSQGDLEQLFAVFDSNRNGVVTRPELREVIVSFRVGLSEAELDRMMATFDASDDGMLQFEEFSELMQGFQGEDNSVEAQMERVFLRFDANRDGGLDARELKVLMEDSGQTVTLREAKGIVFEADADGNGRIDTTELTGAAAKIAAESRPAERTVRSKSLTAPPTH